MQGRKGKHLVSSQGLLVANRIRWRSSVEALPKSDRNTMSKIIKNLFSIFEMQKRVYTSIKDK